MSHTPGPWKFRDSESLVNTFYVEGPHRGDGHYWLVAEVGGQGNDNAHNARLIAAAPDLVVAAECAVKELEWLRTGTWNEAGNSAITHALNPLRAAIAKAKGEA